MKLSRGNGCTVAGAALVLAATAAIPPGKAGDLSNSQLELDRLRQEIAAERQQLADQQQALERQYEALQNQRDRLEALEAQLDGVGGPRIERAGYRVPSTTRDRMRDGGRRTQVQTTPQAGEAPSEERPRVQALVESGGVLLPQGNFVLEPSFEYVRSDVNRAEIVGFTVLPGIVVGNISVVEANRNTYVAALTGRYGVTDRLEIEAKVPYVMRDDSTTTREIGQGASADVVTSADGNDVGDIEAAIHYQLNQPSAGKPYFVGNLRVKSRTGTDPFEVPRDATTNAELELPTGTGFWAIEPSVTAILPSDPAVLYGNLSYLWNMERNIGGQFGKIDPGDAIGLNMGLGIGLNEDLSLSLGYDHKVVGKTTQNGQRLTGSDTLHVGKMLLGSTYRMSDSTSLNLSFGIGVTDDAPDFDFVVRWPITFGDPDD